MSSLQLPSVAPSKDIRHFFPTLDPEQLAAKQDTLGGGAAGAAVAGRRGPYTDWFPPELFDPILAQVRAEPRPRVCDASCGLQLSS